MNDSSDTALKETIGRIQTIETERLRLRLPQLEDREGVWSAAHHEADITKGMLWDPPQTMDELDQKTRESLEGWKRGDMLVWTIEGKDIRQFLGRIVLRKQQQRKDTWYLGFWMHPDEHGKGYATEAARAVLDAAFECLHIGAIISSHADWNAASGKVLVKLGMRHTGHNPSGFIKHGKDVPEEEYELTYDEWLKQKL